MRLRLAALPLLAAALCSPCRAVEDDEGAGCSLKDFRGTYGFVSEGSNVTNNTPIVFAGTLTADGNGKITAWKDWVAVPADPPVPPNFKVVPPVRDIHAMARSLGNEILYTVESDCRLSITTVVPGPTGAPTPVVQLGALTSGGQEALLINGAPGSPFVTVIRLKHVKR